jgi:hypothetical protein
LEDFQKDPYNEPFFYEIPYNEIPDYLNIIAYPIYVYLIKERVLNKVYRTLEHVVWEWELMCKNAMVYNNSSSAIYRLAKKNNEWKYRLLGQDLPTSHSVPKIILKLPVVDISVDYREDDGEEEGEEGTRLRPRKVRIVRGLRKSRRHKADDSEDSFNGGSDND